jgi:hypothetical protein
MSAAAALMGLVLVVGLTIALGRLFDRYDQMRDQREEAEADAERVRRALAAVNRRSLGEPSEHCRRAQTQARGVVTR